MMRKPKYVVKRELRAGQSSIYWVHSNGNTNSVIKKTGGWFASGLYHKTLRDAIIYLAYGV